MKRRLLLLFIGFLVGIAFAFGCHAAGAGTEGDSYHWLLYNTDDAHILCDNGQFTITVNGGDSLYVRCHPIGTAEVDK